MKPAPIALKRIMFSASGMGTLYASTTVAVTKTTSFQSFESLDLSAVKTIFAGFPAVCNSKDGSDELTPERTLSKLEQTALIVPGSTSTIQFRGLSFAGFDFEPRDC